MRNSINLPLEAEGLQAVISAIADAMTYEATFALVSNISKNQKNDELSAESSIFDRLIWTTRLAYMVGYAEAIEVYEAATCEGILHLDSIGLGIEYPSDEEYSKNITQVCEFLKITKKNRPIPRIAVEAEEDIISPRRLTKRLPDGKIEVRADVDYCLEKLWRYENTGFEPEYLLCRTERPHIDFNDYFDIENVTEETAHYLLNLRELINVTYEKAYAMGRKDENESLSRNQ